MKKQITVLFAAIFVLLFTACATTRGVTVQEKRDAVNNMRSQVLTDLYKINPRAKAEIAAAPGYAVFSNANVNLIFASFSGGYGVVDNKRGKRNVYMKMGEVGLGLGLGIKDFRAVFIFQNQAALDNFVENGWEFGGHVDAAAKASDKGAAVSGEALLTGVTVYQLTESGLALQATLKGTRYWKDADLN